MLAFSKLEHSRTAAALVGIQVREYQRLNQQLDCNFHSLPHLVSTELPQPQAQSLLQAQMYPHGFRLALAALPPLA